MTTEFSNIFNCSNTEREHTPKISPYTCIETIRVQWLRGGALDSRLREPGFEYCAAVLKPWASFFTLHYSSSLCLSCINEYLIIDSGGYVYEQPSRI